MGILDIKPRIFVDGEEIAARAFTFGGGVDVMLFDGVPAGLPQGRVAIPGRRWLMIETDSPMPPDGLHRIRLEIPGRPPYAVDGEVGENEEGHACYLLVDDSEVGGR